MPYSIVKIINIWSEITVMGLFYSMMSYFKSFYGTQPLQLNETKIVLSANKLIHTLKLKQLQVQKEAKSLQMNLLVAINQPANVRSAAGQRELMDAVVRKSQLAAAYQEIIRCANVIKNEAKLLETDSNKISKTSVLAICTIIYAYKDLELNSCINLTDFVPEPHPVIDKKQISQPLRDYVEYEGSTTFSINTYILEMCHRNEITLEKVNEVGHNFCYTPSKLVIRESKSSALFALSLEELELEKYEEEQQMQQHVQMKE